MVSAQPKTKEARRCETQQHESPASPPQPPTCEEEDGGASSIREVGMPGMSKGASLTRVNLTPTTSFPPPTPGFHARSHRLPPPHVCPPTLANKLTRQTPRCGSCLTGLTVRGSTPSHRDHWSPCTWVSV